MNDEAFDFISKLEEQLGAKITFKSFCTFYADNKGNIRESGVFLCRFDNSIYYEDFEPQHNDLVELIFNRQRKKKEFIKTSWKFDLDQVESMKIVNQQAARKDPNTEHKNSGALSKLLARQVVEIKLKDGSLLFFEPIDKKEFIKNLDI